MSNSGSSDDPHIFKGKKCSLRGQGLPTRAQYHRGYGNEQKKRKVFWLGEGSLRCLLMLQKHDGLLVMQNQSQKPKSLKLESASRSTLLPLDDSKLVLKESRALPVRVRRLPEEAESERRLEQTRSTGVELSTDEKQRGPRPETDIRQEATEEMRPPTERFLLGQKPEKRKRGCQYRQRESKGKQGPNK